MQTHRIVQQDPRTLIPAAYNPRHISKRMLAALKQSVRDHGFVEPVVVQKSSNTIIGGHQRVRAFLEVCREDNLQVPKVPCVMVDVDDRRARLMNLALNKIDGEFDDTKLQSMLSALMTEPMSTEEILGSGFTSQEIERILDSQAADEDMASFASSVTLSLKFDSVEERDATKALIAERQRVSGKKSGSIVREAIHALGATGKEVH